MVLAKASFGWRDIAGLGVSLVVAGQFSGWNYGLAAGWANMMVATLLMALLCFGLALCVAELAAAQPHAGGLYVYCQNAFGPIVGFVVGAAVFGALAAGTGAAATFINAYCQHVFGLGGPMLKITILAVIAAAQIRGAKEVMKWTVATGVLSLGCIVLMIITLVPDFAVSRLAILTEGGAGLKLDLSLRGVFGAVPFAIWLFISVEQTATASEETLEPERAIPRGMIVAVLTLLVSAVGILITTVGAAGAGQIVRADDPLFAALAGQGVQNPHPAVAVIVGVGGMMGLLATLFSLSYSASRQLYALAREGHLPRFLARTNRKASPDAALIVVMLIGFLTSLLKPDHVLLCVVVSLSACYVVLLAAFVHQRVRAPDRIRPFRASGGIATALLCMGLALVVLLACFRAESNLLAALAGYFTIALAVRALSRGSLETISLPTGQVHD